MQIAMPSPTSPQVLPDTNRQHVAPDVLAVAAEIRDYLAAHPTSADTVEHIAHWWLLRQRAETALARTKAALDHLEALGELERTAAGAYRRARGPER